MTCKRCGEPAVAARGDGDVCSRCAVRADWEAVARTAQGLVVREAVSAPGAETPAAGPVEELSPADPFSA
jgi:hypothetical protein